MAKRTALIAAAAVVALVAVIAGCGKNSGAPGKPPAGMEPKAVTPATFSAGVTETDEFAPDFTLKDTAGQDASKADYSGKILCLDFWATWCAPCVKKLKEYEPIIAKYQDKGVELVAVSLDSTPDVAAGWGKQNSSPFQIVMLDDAFKAAYFPEETGQVPVPQVRIIDRDGNLRYKFSAESTVEDLDLALSKLVTETAGGAEVEVPAGTKTPAPKVPAPSAGTEAGAPK
jgi:peroxiredoxin